jgi:hypothetical protein
MLNYLIRACVGHTIYNFIMNSLSKGFDEYRQGHENRSGYWSGPLLINHFTA